MNNPGERDCQAGLTIHHFGVRKSDTCPNPVFEKPGYS
jgi:hypothetical protein